jgi:hypothetical protein
MALGTAGAAVALAQSDGPVKSEAQPTVTVDGALTDKASYSVLGKAGAPAPVGAPTGPPEALPNVAADSVRSLSMPADFPAGARAWAGYGANGPCIFIQLAPKAPINGACSGTGDKAPQVTLGGEVAVEDDKSGLLPGHVVTAGLAPDGVNVVDLVTDDAQKRSGSVVDNAYFFDSTKKVSGVQLNVETKAGVTQ